jgi:eukaryotic-like serine/threonine-protein kinase
MFAQKQEELNGYELNNVDFVAKSGRVVVVPVYKGAMERADEYSVWLRNLAGEDEFSSRRWADELIKIVKDFKRTLEYLETRSDIDASRIGYQGYSEGSIWAPMLLAAAGDGVRVSALHVGGLYNAKFQPQSDPLNYVTRVKVPTLMLNGIYDVHLTLKEEVEPMFRLLGTPEKDKKLVTYPTDHFIPKSEMIKETLAWYDKYLGPVRR